MKQEIVELLANLEDERVLKMLPCFWDKPNEIGFRIGLSEGPQIKFNKETDDQYTLFLRDIDKNETFEPILVSSEEFEKGQEIYNIIRKITNDNDYKKLLENSDVLGRMIANVNDLVKPTIKKLLKGSDSVTEY